MVFLVRGTLSDGGSIFGKNQLTSLINAEVGVGDDYWIIYLMLPPPKPGEQSFDVGQLLNEAFNLGLTGLSIKVENAGFFQLNATSVNYQEIVSAFPEIPFPADPDFIQLAVKRLTCFWALIDFASWDIGTSIIQIGGSNGSSILKLYGFFASGNDVKTTIFEADFPDFTLFEIFTFQDIRIRYKFTTDTTYSLSGKLVITAFESTFTFTGLVQKEPNRFFAALTLLIGPKETKDPFGAGSMPGINFGEFQFAILRPIPTPTTGIGNYAWFQATVKYSIKSLDVDLSAGIYLENTTPILAFIAINQDLDIGEIFTNSIPGFTWPSDLIDIVFKKGSSLYYCQSGYAAKLNNNPLYLLDTQGNPEPVTSLIPTTFQDGFTIFAPIDLTIWKTISFTGNITIGKQNVSGSIQLNEVIDLYILTIAAPQGTGGTGPIFKFDSKPASGNPYVQFQSSLLFFQEDFGLNTSVTLSRDASQQGAIAVSATLSTTKKYALLGNQPVSLTFTYSKKNGFNVSGWPDFTQADSSVNQIIDIAKEVTKIMKSTDPSGVCGQITNLIAEQAYSNSFTMLPTFETVTQSGVDTLNFILNGTFKVFIAGKEVTSIAFPKTVVIPLPQNISMDDLGNEIVNALKEAAGSFAKSLLDNGEQWAKLAAILFAEKAAQLAAQWLCEGLIDSITAEAITAGGAAVASAIGGGLGIGAAIGAGLGAVGSIFSSCFTAGTMVTRADGSVCPIETVRIGDQLRGINGSVNEVLAFDHPKLGKRKLYAFNDGPFFVTAEHPFLTEKGWKSIDPAATLSENPQLTVTSLSVGDVILMDNGEKLTLNTITFAEAEPETQLYNFKLSGNNSYIANGLIAHNKGSSCFVAGTKVLLYDGSIKNIEEIQIGEILLGMDNMPNTVLSFDHPVLGQRSLYSINDEPFFVTAEHPFMTIKGWKAFDPAATAEENPYLTIGTLRLGDELIMADGTTVQLERIRQTAADASLQLYNFVLDGNNSYYANGYLVHNKGGGGGSDPDPAQPSLSNPPLTLSGETLTLSWNGASYATGYEVQFFDPTGKQIGSTQSLGNSTTSANATISLDVDGGTFKAQVRSARGSKRSDWSVATISKLRNATNLLLSYDSGTDKLVANWNPVDQATGYSVSLITNGTAGTAEPVTLPHVSYTAEPLAAGTYNISVISTAPGWIPATGVSAAQSIIKPAAPQNVAISSLESQLIVTWTVVQGASYTVQLLKDGQPIGQPQDSTTGRVAFQEAATGNMSAQVRVAGTASQLPGVWGISQTISKLPAPATVHFTFDATSEMLNVNWDPVSDNNGYAVQICDAQTKAVVYNGNAGINILKLDIRLANFTAGAGTYLAKVSALASQGKIDSDFTLSQEQIERIASPVTVNLTYNSVLQQLEVNWDNKVTSNNGFAITLYNEHTPDSSVKDLTVAKDVVSVPIPLNTLTLIPGTYLVRVSTMAVAGFINSTYTISAQSVTKAGTPQLQTAQFADNLVTASWTNVQGATSYKLILTGSGTPTIHTATDSPSTFSVSELTAGNYNLTAVATAAGWIDSDPGNAIPLSISPVSLEALAARFFANGSTALVAGKGIMLAFPATTYLVFATTLAHAGYQASETVQALRQEFPDLTPQQVTQALQAAYGTTTPLDFAKQCKAKGFTAQQTGKQLAIVFPGILPNDFAIALAGAGYSATDTTLALKDVFPNLTPQQLTAALEAAFGTTTPADYAKQSKTDGKTASQTGQDLVKNYPGISSLVYTQAIANAGYSQTDTVAALKEQFPQLTAQQFTSVIIATYGKTDANSYAKASFNSGMTSVQTGTQLTQQFPGINEVKFAVALAGAGYSATDTTQALKNSFPKLTPQQFTTAIQTAYPK